MTANQQPHPNLGYTDARVEKTQRRLPYTALRQKLANSTGTTTSTGTSEQNQTEEGGVE